MALRDQPYDPEILAMMYRVLDECMESLVDSRKPDPTTLQGMRLRFAQLILGRVADGETDPEALKMIVLREFKSQMNETLLSCGRLFSS